MLSSAHSYTVEGSDRGAVTRARPRGNPNRRRGELFAESAGFAHIVLTYKMLGFCAAKLPSIVVEMSAMFAPMRWLVRSSMSLTLCPYDLDCGGRAVSRAAQPSDRHQPHRRRTSGGADGAPTGRARL